MKIWNTWLAPRRRGLHLTALAALAGAAATTTFSTPSAAATNSFGTPSTPIQLHNRNGACLDLPSGNTTNGTDLQIWACDNNGLNQTWFMDTAGAIHFGANPSKCLDLPNGNQVDKARIQIWDCDNGGSQDQQWSYGSDGTLKKLTNGVAGKCVELLNGSASNGNIVELYDCNGTSGQTWVPLLGDQVSPVQFHDGNGGCLDLPSGNTTNGTLLQIWACDSDGLNQLWYQDSGGAIHYAANPNKCLDLPNGNQVDHARLQIWDCDNGSSQDQQWVSEPDHTLRKYSNGAPGLCVELLNGSANNGNIVQLFDCNGTSGQTWFPGMYKELSVAIDGQQQSNWCWAATTQMIVGYSGVSVSQCAEANYNTGRTDCCTNSVSASDTTECNQGGWWLLSYYGFNSSDVWQLNCSSNTSCTSTGNSPLSFDQLVAETEVNHPVAFAWHWSSGGGHAMVVAGTKTTSANGAVKQYVTVNNPEPVGEGDQYDQLYTDWVSGSGYSHWRDSYGISKK
ncbi:MAG TPA: ricin-type beta-trefoil lectin domain protein [Polyangiaceae bacterium]|jgi:hypothetical protein